MNYISLFKKNTDAILKILEKYPFAEIRYDSFKFTEKQFLHILKKSSYLITTFRDSSLHSNEFRKKIIHKSLNKSAYIDLDLNNPHNFINEIAISNTQTKLIVSYHNYKNTPSLPFLKNKIEEIFLLNADIAKIATFSNSKKDNRTILKLYDFVKKNYPEKELIAITMGAKGEITRILATKYGSPLTYVSCSNKKKSAPGQISLKGMQKIMKTINEKKMFCVLGNPVFHSKSPNIFNYIFKKLNLEATYTRLHADNIEEGVSTFKKLNFNGMNITSPFKTDIIPFLDEINPIAQKLQAVNLVLRKENKFIGYNTDYLGVLNSFKEKNIEIKNKNILIIGSGGAAKAAIYATKSAKANLKIINRTDNKARELAEQFEIEFCEYKNLEKEVKDAEIVISCVKLGINIIPKNWLNENQIIFDANYTGSNLEKICKQLNLTFISGKDWLVNQAVPSFNFFMEQELDSTFFHKSLNINKTKSGIALIGYMGSGKTTIAKTLAKKLRLKTVSLDDEIEKQEKMSIPEIFLTKGEKYFREKESELLKKYQGNIILDCGGGIIEKEENRNYLKENFLNVWIYSPIKESYQRIMNTDRPLLKENFQNRFHKRKFKYCQTANLIINNHNFQKSLKNLISELKIHS